MENRVRSFHGFKTEREYRLLDELLTQAILKLDKIETNGVEEIREARKNAVKQINDLVRLLEFRASANQASAQNDPILNVIKQSIPKERSFAEAAFLAEELDRVTMQDEKLCKVCFERERVIIFLPCGHFICCGECSEQLELCPACRKSIYDRKHVFVWLRNFQRRKCLSFFSRFSWKWGNHVLVVSICRSCYAVSLKIRRVLVEWIRQSRKFTKTAPSRPSGPRRRNGTASPRPDLLENDQSYRARWRDREKTAFADKCRPASTYVWVQPQTSIAPQLPIPLQKSEKSSSPLKDDVSFNDVIRPFFISLFPIFVQIIQYKMAVESSWTGFHSNGFF